MGKVSIRRIYDEPPIDGAASQGAAADEPDGYRILVDRLWPRGISKERAHLDVWMKDVAPSEEVRRAFHHEAAGFDAFRSAYLQELAGNPAVAELRDAILQHPSVVLLYGAKDPELNQAAVLLQYLESSS